MTAGIQSVPIVDDDPLAGVRREVESLVRDGRLGTVVRRYVADAPALSIGTAALAGYVLGAGVPPAIVSLAARAAGRIALASFLQHRLFTPTRRNP